MHDETGVDGDRAVAHLDVVGVGVAAEPVVGLVERHVAVAGEDPGGDQPGDSTADDGHAARRSGCIPTSGSRKGERVGGRALRPAGRLDRDPDAGGLTGVAPQHHRLVGAATGHQTGRVHRALGVLQPQLVDLVGRRLRHVLGDQDRLAQRAGVHHGGAATAGDLDASAAWSPVRPSPGRRPTAGRAGCGPRDARRSARRLRRGPLRRPPPPPAEEVDGHDGRTTSCAGPAGAAAATVEISASTFARRSALGPVSTEWVSIAAASRRLATSAVQSGHSARWRSKRARSMSSRASTAYAPDSGCMSLMSRLPTCRGAGSVRLGSGSWQCPAVCRAWWTPRCGCTRRSRRAPALRAGCR